MNPPRKKKTSLYEAPSCSRKKRISATSVDFPAGLRSNPIGKWMVLIDTFRVSSFRQNCCTSNTRRKRASRETAKFLLAVTRPTAMNGNLRKQGTFKDTAFAEHFPGCRQTQGKSWQADASKVLYTEFEWRSIASKRIDAWDSCNAILAGSKNKAEQDTNPI